MLNYTHFFGMKIPNKRKFQQIALNHSSDMDIKDYTNLKKNVLQNHVLFKLMILLFPKIVYYASALIS